MADVAQLLWDQAAKQAGEFNSSPFSQFVNAAGAEAGGKLSMAAQDIANALMAPGRALQGGYDLMVDPATGVNYYDGMTEDAANLAGLVSLGAAPIKRPSGSLGMGGRIEDYGMAHRPNVIQEGMTLDNPLYAYGNDIYGPNATQYYGTLDRIADRESIGAILAARSNPDAMITVYRAVPKTVTSINPGDWVTTSKKYANDHGNGWLNGDYTVLEKKVPAGQLATSGDSIHEWGWWP